MLFFEWCNILNKNRDELCKHGYIFRYDDNDFQDKCWILLEKYKLKTLILTCGINGSYVFTPGKVYFQATPCVKVEDTVGAGDSFTAAFVSCLLKGKSVEDAHLAAVQTSAFVCSVKGAMPVLPLQYVK